MSEKAPSVNAEATNEEDEESVMDEDTVVADAPPQPNEDIPLLPIERPTHLHPNSETLIS